MVYGIAALFTAAIFLAIFVYFGTHKIHPTKH